MYCADANGYGAGKDVPRRFGDAARFRFSGGGTPSPMVVAACSDWYRNPDGVWELGLERQVGSSVCFPPGNGPASSLMFLRPCVSDTVLGLYTGLLPL